MTHSHELTVVEAAKKIRQREISPVAMMEDLLNRVSRLEPTLTVWVTLNADAVLETARQRERELLNEGPRGPLHGVPVGIKDIYYTQGVLTTAGSLILADFVPDFDATTVAKLKQAGAIIMGKTVTTEFACGDPSPTRIRGTSITRPAGPVLALPLEWLRACSQRHWGHRPEARFSGQPLIMASSVSNPRSVESAGMESCPSRCL